MRPEHKELNSADVSKLLKSNEPARPVAGVNDPAGHAGHTGLSPGIPV